VLLFFLSSAGRRRGAAADKILGNIIIYQGRLKLRLSDNLCSDGLFLFIING